MTHTSLVEIERSTYLRFLRIASRVAAVREREQYEGFDSTYEGLKRLSVSLRSKRSSGFDSTYEGLKRDAREDARDEWDVSTVPMRA